MPCMGMLGGYRHSAFAPGFFSRRVPTPFCFEIHIEPSFETWTPALYAFRVGGEVVRIGKTESQSLRKCFGVWEKSVSRALQGDFRRHSTTPYEAFEYRRLILEQHKTGEVLARQEELIGLDARRRALIKDWDPYLCNDSCQGKQRAPERRAVNDIAAAKADWLLLNGELHT